MVDIPMFKDNKLIWVRDNEHGFLLGRITDIGSDNFTVRLNDTRKVCQLNTN